MIFALAALGWILQAPAQETAAPAPAPDASAAIETSVEDAAQQGLKALEAGDHSKAIALFEQIVAADPEDYAAHYHLALALSKAGRADEAKPHYRKALKQKPDLYQAQINLAVLHLEAREAEAAIGLLQQAFALKPAEFLPNYYLGEALVAAGKAAEGLPHLEKAVHLQPGAPEVHHSLGRALAAQAKFSEARAHYEQAAALDPYYRRALVDFAQLLERNQKTEEAIAIYRSFPEEVSARERIGYLMLKDGKFKEAVPEFEAAVRLAPSAVNHLALATAYLQTGQSDLSLQQVQKAAELNPEQYEVHLMRGRLLRDQQKYPQAIAAYMEAIKRNSTAPEPWSEMALLLVRTEQYPQALAALDRLEKINGFQPGHHFLRAVAYDKMKAYEQALAEYQRFLASGAHAEEGRVIEARSRASTIKKILEKK